MKAHEIFESQEKNDIGAYFIALDEIGLAGKLAHYLLRAQRTGDRELKAAKHPGASPYEDYLRFMHSRNDFAIRELLMFCTEPWHMKALAHVRLKRFKYGIRLTMRNQPAIRFRRIDGRWRGDESNLGPICAYCDGLMRDNDVNESKPQSGRLFSWPTAI